MRHLTKSLATLVLLACAAPLAFAASSAASSLSDSLTQSSGSVSDSLKGSSHSSSPDDKQVKGDYKVTDVAEATDKPGFVELHLQPVATGANAGAEIYLTLPRTAAEQHHVAAGATVTALQRPYGIEFATAQPRAAFFLALADDVARDMKMAPVAL